MGTEDLKDARVSAEPAEVKPKRVLTMGGGGRVATIRRLAAALGGGLAPAAAAPSGAMARLAAAGLDAAAEFKRLVGLVEVRRSRRPKRGRGLRKAAKRRAVRNAMAKASRMANWPR